MISSLCRYTEFQGGVGTLSRWIREQTALFDLDSSSGPTDEASSFFFF